MTVRLPWQRSAVCILMLLALPACAGIFGKKKPAVPAPDVSKKVDWHEKYTAPGTLGADLETSFKQLLGLCSAETLDPEHPNLSAVPRPLQLALEVNAPIITQKRDAAATIFAYVFPRKDLSAYNSLGSEFISATLFGDSNIPQPGKGRSYVIYTESCSSILRAAISAELKPPFSSLRGALNNQYDANYSLALVRGAFFSPLAALLSAETDESLRLNAYLTIWLAYLDNKNLVGRPNYYLYSFDGLSTYTLVGRSLANEYNVTAKAGGNWVVASIDASVGASGKATYRLDARLNNTAIFADATGNAGVVFRDLPSPGDIASEFARRRPTYGYTSESNLLLADQVHSHYFDIEGIPASFCGGDRWKLTNTTIHKLKLVSVKPVTDDSRTCRFSVDYVAPHDITSHFPSAIGYDIEAQTAVGDAALRVSVSFPTRTSNEPQLTPQDLTTSAKLESEQGKATLLWLVALRKIDAKNPISPTQDPQLTDYSLSCSQVTVQDVKARFVPLPENGLGIEVSKQLKTGETIDSTPDTATPCIFRASFSVPLKARVPDQSRSLQTTLSMPRVVAPKAAEPASSTSTSAPATPNVAPIPTETVPMPMPPPPQ